MAVAIPAIELAPNVSIVRQLVLRHGITHLETGQPRKMGACDFVLYRLRGN